MDTNSAQQDRQGTLSDEIQGRIGGLRHLVGNSPIRPRT